MKKRISLFLSLVLMLCCFVIPASAAEKQPESAESYIEYCEDGGYFVIEVATNAPVSKATTTSGYKTATYYTSGNVALWSVTVHGYFSYDYGVSAKATSATATVYIYDSKVEMVSKNAYITGASAVGKATMKYGTVNTLKTVTLTCDKYGKLS